MIIYNIKMARKAIEEAAGLFEMTKSLHITNVKYRKAKQQYVVVLANGTKHLIDQEYINTYIESLGDKGGREIARALIHSIEQQESALNTGTSQSDEVWDGDFNDVTEYLQKKEKDLPPDYDIDSA